MIVYQNESMGSNCSVLHGVPLNKGYPVVRDSVFSCSVAILRQNQGFASIRAIPLLELPKVAVVAETTSELQLSKG